MDEESLYFQIYVMRADGKKRVRLTHSTQDNWLPAWSPDGQTIAYGIWDGILDGNLLGTIHVMTADGKHLRTCLKSRQQSYFWSSDDSF